MNAEFKIDFLESYSEKDIVEELKRIAVLVPDRPITKKDIQRHGRLSYSVIHKKFGGLTKALIAAGIKPTSIPNPTDGQLLVALIDLWSQTLTKEGRRPERRDLKRYLVPHSGDAYYRHLGSWKKALLATFKLANQKGMLAEIEKPSEARSTATQRTEISLRKRFFVFKRDEFTCVKCGRSGRGIKLEVDHVTPVSRGGTDALDNLQTLCFDCNRGKRNDYD
jgi:hypothetical protein